MNDFLKKLKESLEAGQKNDDIVKHINIVEEKSIKITEEGNAEELIKKRLEMAGDKVVDLSEDEIKKHNKQSELILSQMKEEDERWSEQALISNMRNEVKNLEEDFEELKEKYQKNMNDMLDRLHQLEKEYEKRHGVDINVDLKNV